MSNKQLKKPDLVVNVVGEVCPVPLVQFRKAIKSVSLNSIIELIGDDASSKKEIPMAIEELNLLLLSIFDDENGNWHILIKKTKEV